MSGIHITPEWQDVSGGFRAVDVMLADHPLHTGGPQRGIAVRFLRQTTRPTTDNLGETLIVRPQAQRLILSDRAQRLWLKSAETQLNVFVRLADPDTAGEDVSDEIAKADGTTIYRRLGSRFADAAVLEDYGYDVGTGDTDADTAALIAAMAAGAQIHGRPGVPFYYISHGALCAAGAQLRDIRLMAKLGPGGFSSTDVTSAVRYDQNHVMLYWNGVDGGGCHNLEIYGDGGGDYALTGLALRGGFTTKPFVATGYLFLHHFPMVTGGILIEGVGPQGYEFDTIRLEDGATTVPVSYWGTTQINIYGLYVDGDSAVASGKGRVNRLIGKRLSLTGAAMAPGGGAGLTGTDQSDLFTIQGSQGSKGNADNGVEIGYLYAEEVGEPCDIQGRGNRIHHIEALNCSGTVFKVPHGGNHNWVGHINARGCGRSIVGFGGSIVAEPIPDVEGNIVESVTGENHGGYTYVAGTIVSATATTAVLPPGSIPFDDYWNSYGIRIRTGTGATTTRVLITDCVAATNTITLAAWAGGTPNNTSTFSIHPAFETSIASFATVASATNIPINNFVRINGVHSDGDLTFLADAHVAGMVGNQVEVNRDLGCYSTPVSMQGATAGLKVFPGPAQRAICKLSLTAGFSTAATTEVIVPWDTILQDTYQQTTNTGAQASLSENGIRCRLPGLKHFQVALRIAAGGAVNMLWTGKLYRGVGNAAVMELRQALVGAQNLLFAFDVYHPETEFDGTENLYTFKLTPSAATGTTFTSNGFFTWFSMSD